MDTSRSDNDSRERPSQKSKSSQEKSYENKNYDFAFNIFDKYDFALNLLRFINPGRYMFVKCYENRISKVHQCRAQRCVLPVSFPVNLLLP